MKDYSDISLFEAGTQSIIDDFIYSVQNPREEDKDKIAARFHALLVDRGNTYTSVINFMSIYIQCLKHNTCL